MGSKAAAYYNENDPFAAAWLRNLIDADLIAPGEVDERSIVDVRPKDLRGFVQHHFFAGIGGWSYALRLAGWSDNRPCVTGSCPCQPFSSAGKREGVQDERHLWPAFRWLIAQLRPATCWGEQVASAAGREWLAGVRADLEAMGYAVGAADLCAAGVGAPHLRQRLWWVAGSVPAGWSQRGAISGGGSSACRSPLGSMANAEGAGHSGREHAGASGQEAGAGPRVQRTGGHGAPFGLPDRSRAELQGFAPAWNEQPDRGNLVVLCADGKARRIPSEPSLFPLADGVPNRVGTLRGAGNAIVPEIAAEFVKAYMDANVRE